MSRDPVLAPEIQDQIDKMEEEIHQLDRAKEALNRKIDELKAGQSPIGVGDYIEWEKHNRASRTYLGRVKSVEYSSYRGFCYHVIILSKAGREIGTARVTEDHEPILTNWRPEPASAE